MLPSLLRFHRHRSHPQHRHLVNSSSFFVIPIAIIYIVRLPSAGDGADAAAGAPLLQEDAGAEGAAPAARCQGKRQEGVMEEGGG